MTDPKKDPESDPTEELKREELTRAQVLDEEFELPEGFLTADTEELVLRAQGGDSEALNTLFTRYQSTVMDAARRGLGPRLKLKESPEDLTQTTFREATRDFGSYSYRGKDSLVRWLVRILQNKIRDKAEFYTARKRDISRERTLVSPTDDGDRTYDPPSGDLSITRSVSRDEEFAILRQALDKLSDDHRRAITLVFFQGMTLREAGSHMSGRTEDAVRMLLRRAEARLRDLTKSDLQSE
jgi:RNA polymerase sigma factor (sigma-70 family)